VRSLAALEEVLRRAALTTRRRERDLLAIFPAELGQGAWLFTE